MKILHKKKWKLTKQRFLLMYLKLKWAFDLTSSSSSSWRILDPSKNWYTPIVCDNKMHTLIWKFQGPISISKVWFSKLVFMVLCLEMPHFKSQCENGCQCYQLLIKAKGDYFEGSQFARIENLKVSTIYIYLGFII